MVPDNFIDLLKTLRSVSFYGIFSGCSRFTLAELLICRGYHTHFKNEEIVVQKGQVICIKLHTYFHALSGTETQRPLVHIHSSSKSCFTAERERCTAHPLHDCLYSSQHYSEFRDGQSNPLSH